MATGVLRQNNQMLGCVFLTAVAMWWCKDAARYEAVLHVLAFCMRSIFQGCSLSLTHSLTHPLTHSPTHSLCFALQSEHFIQCRTQGEQLQLLSKVINSKESLEALERECGRDETGAWMQHKCHLRSAGQIYSWVIASMGKRQSL
jgi:hypothetical protein